MKKMLSKIRSMLGGRYFIHKKVLELVELNSGDSLLDIGCGRGEVLELIHAKFGNKVSLTGVDVSPDTIWLAKESEFRTDKDSNIKFKVASAEDLPFPDNSFDFAVSVIMAHHLNNAQKLKMVGEAKRVLKPGGKLLISDIGRPKNIFGQLASWISCNQFYTKNNMEVIESALKENNMEVVKFERQLGFLEHFLTKK